MEKFYNVLIFVYISCFFWNHDLKRKNFHSLETVLKLFIHRLICCLLEIIIFGYRIYCIFINYFYTCSDMRYFFLKYHHYQLLLRFQTFSFLYLHIYYVILIYLSVIFCNKTLLYLSFNLIQSGKELYYLLYHSPHLIFLIYFFWW